MHKVVHKTKDMRKKGYAKPGVFWGRRSKKNMMKGVQPGYVKSRLTAHNEVTRWYENGITIVRFHRTDLLWIHPDGSFYINTGGWLSVATKRHLNNALKRHGLDISVEFERKNSRVVISFKTNRGDLITGGFHKAGGFKPDGKILNKYDVEHLHGGTKSSCHWNTHMLELPSHWSSAIYYEDFSSLDAQDKKKVKSFKRDMLKSFGEFNCLDVEYTGAIQSSHYGNLYGVGTCETAKFHFLIK